jgi:hypothetical protein
MSWSIKWYKNQFNIYNKKLIFYWKNTRKIFFYFDFVTLNEYY